MHRDREVKLQNNSQEFSRKWNKTKKHEYDDEYYEYDDDKDENDD